MKGVLAVTDEPLVSSDFNHIAASSTAAIPQTQVIVGQLARVLTWYDNEWGFSTRMADTALAMAKFL
jgi:glyceraldehyde 3-phosphate dehydrogenase